MLYKKALSRNRSAGRPLNGHNGRNGHNGIGRAGIHTAKNTFTRIANGNGNGHRLNGHNGIRHHNGNGNGHNGIKHHNGNGNGNGYPVLVNGHGNGNGNGNGRAPADVSDETLLKRISQHKSSALREFHSRHSTMLRNVVESFVHEGGETDDVLQEVFLQIWKEANHYSPKAGKPLGWVDHCPAPIHRSFASPPGLLSRPRKIWKFGSA